MTDNNIMIRFLTHAKDLTIKIRAMIKKRSKQVFEKQSSRNEKVIKDRGKNGMKEVGEEKG